MSYSINDQNIYDTLINGSSGGGSQLTLAEIKAVGGIARINGVVQGGQGNNQVVAGFAGAAAGAAAGTAIVPGLGTAIGAVLGFVGGFLTSKPKTIYDLNTGTVIQPGEPGYNPDYSGSIFANGGATVLQDGSIKLPNGSIVSKQGVLPQSQISYIPYVFVALIGLLAFYFITKK